MATGVLLRLAALTGEPRYRAVAERARPLLAGRIAAFLRNGGQKGLFPNLVYSRYSPIRVIRVENPFGEEARKSTLRTP